MEPIQLSAEEQIALFMELSSSQGTSSPMWEKGADLCLRYDIEQKQMQSNKSKLQRYIARAMNSANTIYEDLNIASVEKYINKGVHSGIFSSDDKTALLAGIVLSGAVEDKKNLDHLFSREEVRAYLHREYNKISPENREKDEKLKSAYKRLRVFEQEQIVRGGRTADDVTLKKNIKAVLGKEMTEAVYKGIAPHKEAIPELVAKAKEKGLSAEQIKEAVHEARRIAKEKAESDKLQDKQNTLEKEGFVPIFNKINKKTKEI